MRALLCPASLKGVLTARDAAAALARGVRAPEVTRSSFRSPTGARGRRMRSHSALGGSGGTRSCPTRSAGRSRRAGSSSTTGAPWSRRRAAIGLPLLTPAERDPLVASSRGLGELVARRASRGAPRAARRPRRERDGGRRSGCARGPPRAPGPDDAFSATCARPSRDAARLFGPQKGASAEDVAVLERRLAGMEELQPYAGLPGAGAAGGLGAAFAALGAELVAGAPAVLDLVGFDEQASRRRPRRHRRRSGRRDDGRGQGAGRRRRAVRRGRRPVRRLRRTRRSRASRCRDGQPVRRSRVGRGRPRRPSGGGSSPSGTRRSRDGQPTTRASSTRPADATRRTAGTRRPATRMPSRR